MAEDDVHTVKDVQKTKLCRHFLRGLCWRGEQCLFAHGKYELRQNYDLYKTTVCRYHQSGSCLYGARCRYAHTSKELRDRPPWALDDNESSDEVAAPIAMLCIMCTEPQDNSMIVLSCGHSLHRDCFERASIMSLRQCPLCCAPVGDSSYPGTVYQPKPVAVLMPPKPVPIRSHGQVKVDLAPPMEIIAPVPERTNSVSGPSISAPSRILSRSNTAPNLRSEWAPSLQESQELLKRSLSYGRGTFPLELKLTELKL
eukprot:TRINITY_DN14492_c0_g1_i1.p1 TRINITY_DN14492_c0_g1~~TRINITY_DN14492_c0_g1_i1.p1  ORF type:complete len:256 (+),score=15.45 TRINITY_DN14492_c0_g1_i1:31-798(+)